LALHLASLVHYERREPEAAHGLAEAEIALADEHGFREFSASGRALKAWAMTELGQTQQGIAELEAIAVSVRRLLHISLSIILAHAYVRASRAEQALLIIGDELAGIERSGAHMEAAELYRLKGEAILMRDSSVTAKAEACFSTAIELARGQSAKWWELRATTSLARLLRDTGHRDEARKLLSRIYNWFTEGFDTADLKEARALLDKLSD
jgi:predicted ATPase